MNGTRVKEEHERFIEEFFYYDPLQLWTENTIIHLSVGSVYHYIIWSVIMMPAAVFAGIRIRRHL